MERTEKKRITVETEVNASPYTVWKLWTSPEHITKWNQASDDWHSPAAENDLRLGGKFLTRMEARDGSEGFDFTGTYDEVDYLKKIEYTIEDGRKVVVDFESDGQVTRIKESFEAEETNSADLQKSGWQAILNNFRSYVESDENRNRLTYEIVINAHPEKVYKTMLEKPTYEKWTAEFNPTSTYNGSWDKGSKILFIGENKEGKQEGMVSRIIENILNKYVCIGHIGIYRDGEEITSGPEVEAWSGATEAYSFFNSSNSTRVMVELEGMNDYKEYFDDSWPKALQKLKQLCENL